MLTAAHELRNLLGIICGYSELGIRERKPARDCFEVITKTAARCEGVIADMIARNRAVEEASLDDAAEIRDQADDPIDLNMIARTTKTALEGMHVSEGLLVKLDLQEALPTPCEGNSDDLFRAVYNLTLNARSAGAKRITIRTRCFEDKVWLSVQDDGRGMLREKLSEVLSADSKPTKEHGRGLSIVRSCIAGLGGQLLGESTVGRGTTFTIVFRGSFPAASRPAGSERPIFH